MVGVEARLRLEETADVDLLFQLQFLFQCEPEHAEPPDLDDDTVYALVAFIAVQRLRDADELVGMQRIDASRDVLLGSGQIFKAAEKSGSAVFVSRKTFFKNVQ